MKLISLFSLYILEGCNFGNNTLQASFVALLQKKTFIIIPS